MENKFDKEFWSKRYENQETGWDLGAPSTPLKEYIDQLKNKNLKILIPGAGNAYEAEYLFNKGFTNVTIVDIAKTPLENIKKRLPDFPKDKLIHGDFFEFKGNFDVIIEQTFFCALDPSLRKQYVDQMYNLLTPKGKLTGVVFTDPLDTDHPPFGASLEEYKSLFSERFELKIIAPCYNSISPRAGRELFIIFEKR